MFDLFLAAKPHLIFLDDMQLVDEFSISLNFSTLTK